MQLSKWSVTRHHATEHQLKEAAKEAETAYRIQRNLVTKTSREIRASVNSISDLCRSLQSAGGVTALQDKNLQSIQGAVEHLMSLAEGIVAVAPTDSASLTSGRVVEIGQGLTEELREEMVCAASHGDAGRLLELVQQLEPDDPRAKTLRDLADSRDFAGFSALLGDADV